ncbi:MAG: hypothetical protein IJ343_10305 [Clostridia bacterium]|nr:hypothetical protein [Clostridia bacterium]
MMKKLLALLIALLLPASALAQASCTEYLLTLDEELCMQMLENSGLFAEDQARKLGAAVVKVLNGLGLRIFEQENGGAVEVLVCGKPLTDFTALETAGQVIITTPLAPGYGLTFPAGMTEALQGGMAELLTQADMEQLTGSVLEAVMHWVSDVEMNSSYGRFSGDAYEGGVACTTIVLDDSDVATLLSGILTEDVRRMISVLLDDMGANGQSTLQQLDALNKKVADSNAHQYLLRIVQDDQERIIGMSAVIMRGKAQLGTLSVGLEETQVRVVFGTGMPDKNYWLDMILQEGAAQHNGSFALSATVRELTGEKEEDFRYASAVVQTLLAQSDISFECGYGRNGSDWRYVQKTFYPQHGTTETLDFSSVTADEHTQTCSLKFLANDREYMSLTMKRQPCEPVTADHAGLTLCDLTAGDEEMEALVEEIGEQMGMNLVVRLLDVIPMNVLTTFMYY